MTPKVLIFYNSQAGKANQLQIIERIKEKFEAHGLAADQIKVVTPETASEAQAEAKQASQAGVEMLVVLGGDGSINAIVSGIYEGGGQTKLGIIPSGTVNNYARALHIPLQIEAAIDNLIDGKALFVDLCQVNDRYMISSLTLGILADIAASVTSEAKRKYGKLAFLKNSVKIIRRNRTYPIEIKADGQVRRIKTKILLITMTPSVAGFTNFDQEANLHDRLMSIYILTDFSFWKLLKHLPAFVTGRLAQVKEVEHIRAHQASIRLYKHRKRSAQTRIDGDKSDKLPIDMVVLHNAIKVVVPDEG